LIIVNAIFNIKWQIKEREVTRSKEREARNLDSSRARMQQLEPKENNL
jgi:hypothetical protein